MLAQRLTFPRGPGGWGPFGDTDTEAVSCLSCLEDPGQVRSRAAKPLLLLLAIPATAKPLMPPQASRRRFCVPLPSLYLSG